MPPKKRAAQTAKAAKADGPTAAKQVKSEEPVTKDSIIAKLKEADKNDKRPKIRAIDKSLPNASAYSVYSDYDCMLNQTNIGDNNNKFYIIQLLQSGSSYYCWNRWGRVGEIGQNNGLDKFGQDVNGAIKSFEKKFKDKTANNWNERTSFVPKSGKYTLIEMDAGADEDAKGEAAESKPGTSKVDLKDCKPCKLEPTTQELIKLIYHKDMFKEALASFDINVKKMPLGKLSKGQIAKGFEVLEEIEECLKSKKTKQLNDLSSKFYTVIPQDFGRQRPPPIDTEEKLQKKYDMLVVLSDIELAQSMQETAEKETAKDVSKGEESKPPHPDDVNYDLLKCKLELLDKKSEEFKVIENYTNQTSRSWHQVEIMNVWKVDRENEATRFKEHSSITNRKLLWHGTNVAVVVAILKTGLRIMPHSGGRVGRGIYFASENGKSADYVGTTSYKSNNVGIMFLNEVALGNEHHIYQDDSRLVRPPAKFDCVIARGMTEPDPTKDTKLKIDGKDVVVPQGKPLSQGITSSFSQSEYLVYQESQARIRYLLQMKFWG